MDDRHVKRRLAAIVSIDVKGYSRLMADDEVETINSLKICRKLITTKTRIYQGRIVDSPGDNILSEFLSVTDAVECAVEIQAALLAYNNALSQNRKMEFRIGINLGDVIEDSGQIYGEGVNLAARLESMAAGGGVCISGSAFEQVKNRLPLGYKFLGRKTLTHIKEPIPVYTVLTEPRYSGKLIYASKKDNPGFRRNKKIIIAFLLILFLFGGVFIRMTTILLDKPSPGVLKDKFFRMHIPDKPSIAVLPFMNMSGDKDQDYFSDGLTEDLITDLSKISGLFVIARNSVFSYKGKNIKMDTIRKELGVRYVLEGSVRKIEDRVRITAQLIDAGTQGHIWAERYDRDLEDIFSLQDEVREKIVTALAIQLTSDDKKRIKTRKTKNLQAYDYYLRGVELQSMKMKGGLPGARQMFQKAIDLDPTYARAYSALGHTWLMEWIFGFNLKTETLDKARELGLKAVSIDEKESSGYSLIAGVHLWRKQHDKAIEQTKKAIELEPSNARWIADLGEEMTWAGNPHEAIPYLKKAMRLDPKYPSWFLWNLGHAYFLTEQYDLAIEAFQKALVRDENFWPSHLFLVLCYDATGQSDKAEKEILFTLKANKNLSFENWEDRLPYKDSEMAGKLIEKIGSLGIK